MPVFAPDLTLYGVANVIGARRGNAQQARYMLRIIEKRCGENIVAVDADLMAAALDIASEHGLHCYDAAYAAAADRNGWTLVGTDVTDLVSRGLAVAPDAADDP